MSQNLECQIDTPDYKAEVWFLVNDFLEAQEIQWANDIKEIIRSKISESCSTQEIQNLRDDFSERWQLLSGKQKMKMYELSAMLSNHLKEMRNNPQIQNTPQPLWADVYGWLETSSTFERNEVPQHTFQLDAGYATGNKEYFFNPEKSHITHLWWNTYEITYSFSRERGKYLTSSSNEKVTLQIWESWHHILSSDFSRRSTQVFSPIQNNGQSDTIELKFRDGDKNITLILSRPNQQQQIFIRH